MSNISTAFEAVKTLCAATFSAHTQLTNPYDLEQNTTLALSKGYGIALGGAVNTQRNLTNQLSLQRSFSVTLTRRRYANELDTASKETAEKAILEDQYLLIKAMEKEPAINSVTSGIAKCIYMSDAGIESLVAGEEIFIKLTTVFDIEYFENLN